MTTRTIHANRGVIRGRTKPPHKGGGKLPPPCARYAVVVHPGTLWQEVDQYCSTLQNAIRWQMDCFPQGEGVPTDVMRVLSDGTLTTEL